jgi:hypothetical protein
MKPKTTKTENRSLHPRGFLVFMFAVKAIFRSFPELSMTVIAVKSNFGRGTIQSSSFASPEQITDAIVIRRPGRQAGRSVGSNRAYRKPNCRFAHTDIIQQSTFSAS